MKHDRSVQQSLPPMLLQKNEQADAVLPNQEHAVSASEHLTMDAAEALASTFFDAALTKANISSSEAAYLFGCTESLVNKMRSPNSRERVSYAHMLLLPLSYWVALHKVMNQQRRFNFARAALGRLLDEFGYLAAVSE